MSPVDTPFNPAATGGATDPLDTGTAIRTGAVVPPFRRDFDNARDPYVARVALGLGPFTGSVTALVPASPGGKAKSLRADGTWLAGMTFLAELIASTSASLADTTSITGAFDLYMIELENVVPATDADDIQV